jgi:tetratricopeptide (TPR) repeat protein
MNDEAAEISHLDAFHLRAAQGWLELKNYVEANEELEKISPLLRARPDILQARWGIYAKAKRWANALEIARTLIDTYPDEPFGWIHRAFALHELRRTDEAYQAAYSALDKFPHDATLRYNLACYACQLGRLDEARDWLEKSFLMPDSAPLKLSARDDPDLQPLWNQDQA